MVCAHVPWWRLIACPLNLTHKVSCSITVGGLGMFLHSWQQLAALVVLQCGMVAYLVAAWPYKLWQLQLLEVTAHVLQLAITCLAAATPRPMDAVTWAMIGRHTCTQPCGLHSGEPDVYNARAHAYVMHPAPVPPQS